MMSQLTGLPTVFVRKAAKEYGTRSAAEGGPVDGLRVVGVEDVGPPAVRSSTAVANCAAAAPW